VCFDEAVFAGPSAGAAVPVTDETLAEVIVVNPDEVNDEDDVGAEFTPAAMLATTSAVSGLSVEVSVAVAVGLVEVQASLEPLNSMDDVVAVGVAVGVAVVQAVVGLEPESEDDGEPESDEDGESDEDDESASAQTQVIPVIRPTDGSASCEKAVGLKSKLYGFVQPPHRSVMATVTDFP